MESSDKLDEILERITWTDSNTTKEPLTVAQARAAIMEWANQRFEAAIGEHITSDRAPKDWRNGYEIRANDARARWYNQPDQEEGK